MMTPTQLQDRFISDKSNYDPRLVSRNRTRFAIHLLHGIARVLLLSSLCLAPWCLGGVEPDSQAFLYAIVLTSLLVWCIATAFTQSTLGLAPIRLPPLIGPLLGVLVLGAYQLRVTPGNSNPERAKSKNIAAASEVAAMDSNAWSADSTLGIAPGQTSSTAPSNESSSLLKKLLPQNYPLQTIAVGLTRFETARYSIAIVAFFLGVVLFQSHMSQVWLCGALALNGAVLSVFGVLQNLTWNGRLFWIIPLSLGGEPFASFVNRRNAAGYLSLTLAAAAGMIYWAYCRREWFDGAQRIIDDGLRNGSRRFHRRVFRNLKKILATLDRYQIAATFVATLILMGIIGSRSGLLATTVAGMTCVFLLCRLRGELRSLSAVAIELGLFTIGLVVWTGVVGNAGSWGRSDRRSEVQANWHDALRVVDDFPATGSGLGTYAYGYLPYQVRPATVWFTHADNQFVEILVEGGIVGVGLVVVLILTSLGSTLALGRNRNRPADDPAGLVGTFAVISQAISACFDYGTTLPATMLTLAVVMGAVTGRGARLADTEDPKTWWLACPGLRPAWMILLLGTAFLLNGVFAWREVLFAAQARIAYRGLPQRLDTSESLPLDEVNRAIGRLNFSIARRSDDADAHRALGELWIYRYRLAALDALRRHSNANDPEAWNRTDVSGLYALANEWDADGKQQQLDELRESPLVVENLLSARRHFAMAQCVSPLLPGVDLPLAMLEFLDPAGKINGIAHLERAVVLTPTDPETLDAAAILADAAGLSELAYGCWRRELLLRPDALQRIASRLAGRIGIQEQLEYVIPNSPQVFMELASTVYAGSGNERTRKFLITKVVQVLTEQSETMLASSEGLHLMARARRLLDESESAVHYYRLALAQEPMQLDWRLELVDLLRSQGRIALALKQAELCLSIDPHRSQTQVLIRELRAELATEASSRKAAN